MANWKKVIVSGSNAELNQVTASFFSGDGSALTNVPAGSINIESFTDGTGITVETTDKLILSDAGVEKYIQICFKIAVNDICTKTWCINGNYPNHINFIKKGRFSSIV